MFNKTIRQCKAHPECYLDVSLASQPLSATSLGYSSRTPNLNKTKRILMKRPSFKRRPRCNYQRRSERATDVKIEPFREKAKRCSQESYLMQTGNQGIDHLAGPFGCVFTLFDSQPWTRRNMLVNS